MDVPQILYDWYLQKWWKDEEIADHARETVKYTASEVVTRPISKSEFVRWLSAPTNNPGIKQDWINGFTSGHEADIAKFPASVQRFLRDCDDHPPTFLDAKELRDAS